MERKIIQPVDAMKFPRFSGISTFARLPLVDVFEQVSIAYDIAILGVPFDAGTTYRPGARFGPAAVRQSSRILRPYNPAQDVRPFADQQVVDVGDVPCSPFSISEAVQSIEEYALKVYRSGNPNNRLLCIGGDHTISFPLLRAAYKTFGMLSLVHFDAHLDTFGPYFGQDVTHGTPFRNAAEEGLFDPETAMHVGARGSVYSPEDLLADAELGFKIIRCSDLEESSCEQVASRIAERVNKKSNPLYISIDIDVLDPAFAPGTGTPECGGLTSRELILILRKLKDKLHVPLVGADVVEVSPSYDHAEITSLAAATTCYELLCLMAKKK